MPSLRQRLRELRRSYWVHGWGPLISGIERQLRKDTEDYYDRLRPLMLGAYPDGAAIIVFQGVPYVAFDDAGVKRIIRFIQTKFDVPDRLTPIVNDLPD